MTQFIFVYNGPGSGPNSRDDLKELFTKYPIYQASDVVLSDFQANFDGLYPENVTIVLPGGQVPVMATCLYSNRTKLQTLFSNGAQGVFICAGAYLAAAAADVFFDEYTRDDTTRAFKPLKHWLNTRDEYLMKPKIGSPEGVSLNILSDYKAYGSFIPNDTYDSYFATPLSGQYKKPYSVNLLLEDTQQSTHELFLGGCGFEPLTDQASSADSVVARYQDQSRYTFFYKSGTPQKTIPNMPAIIRKPGILASGVHIETCVEESKLLKLMREGDCTSHLPTEYLPLQDTRYDQEASRSRIIPLLQVTLNPKSR
jgi:glutamine amidotransferase-like uncharacterized protein